MKLHTTETKTFTNHAMCDCGGEFIHKLKDGGDILGMFFNNDPNKFRHVCDKCEKVEFFQRIYPEVLTVEYKVDQNSEIVKTVQKGKIDN